MYLEMVRCPGAFVDLNRMKGLVAVATVHRFQVIYVFAEKVQISQMHYPLQ